MRPGLGWVSERSLARMNNLGGNFPFEHPVFAVSLRFERGCAGRGGR